MNRFHSKKLNKNIFYWSSYGLYLSKEKFDGGQNIFIFININSIISIKIKNVTELGFLLYTVFA